MKQNLFGYMGEAVGFVSNLVFNILLPIFLGAVVFGQLSITLGFAYFLVGLFNSGFNHTVTRFVSKYYAQKKYGEMIYLFKYLLKLKIIFSFFISLGLFLVAYPLSVAYEIPVLSIQIVSILIFLSAILTYLLSFFTAIQKNQVSLMASFINASFLIVFPLLAYFLGFKLNGIIIAVILSYLVATLFILVHSFKTLKKFKTKPKKINKRRFNDNIIGFSIISSLTVFIYWGILLILGFFAPSSEVAFFKISISWVLAVIANVPISYMVVFSSFINLKTNKSKLLTRYIQKILRYGFIFVIPAMFGMALLGPKMIQIIYGRGYLRAALPLVIICWAILPLFANKILLSILVSMNKLKQVSKIYLASTIIGFVVTIFLVMRYGLVGAAVSFVFTNYLIFILMYNSIKIIKKGLNVMIKPIIASIVMSVIVYYLIPLASSLVNGLFLILVGVVVYFVVLYLIKGFNKEDLKVLKLLKK